MNRDVQLSELYAKLYEELYNDYIEVGLIPDKAQAKAYDKVDVAREVIEDSLDELFYDGITLRHIYPISLIKDWDIMSNAVKKMTLEKLGFNCNVNWRERKGEFVFGRERLEGEYVEGQERCDEEYIKSGNASWGSELMRQEQIHGKEHAVELDRKMRGR